MSNLLTEQISHDDLKKYLKAFYKYAKKVLEIERDPRLFFRRDQNNADDFLGKTGYYDPEREEIHLFITDRHPKDIVRSFAHELIHHLQKLTGMTDQIDMSMTGNDPAYSLHNELLRAIEIHAFKDGNLTFRDWTDKLKIGEIVIIAENKNVINEATFEDKVEAIIKNLRKSGKKKGLRKSAERIAGAMVRDEKKTKKENKTMKVKVKRMEEKEKMMDEMKKDSEETEEIKGLDYSSVPRNLADVPEDSEEELEMELEPEEAGEEKLGKTLPMKSSEQMAFEKRFGSMDAVTQAKMLAFLAKKAKDKKMAEIALKAELAREERAAEKAKEAAGFAALPGTKPPMAESKNTPYPVLFEQRERLLKEAYQTREERVYSELIRRFIKK